MAGTVVPNMTTISMCEATTGWTVVMNPNLVIENASN